MKGRERGRRPTHTVEVQGCDHAFTIAIKDQATTSHTVAARADLRKGEGMLAKDGPPKGKDGTDAKPGLLRRLEYAVLVARVLTCMGNLGKPHRNSQSALERDFARGRQRENERTSSSLKSTLTRNLPFGS